MVTKVDARRETASLIGSDKVEGTAVYGPDDRKIGTVQRVMIDKTSGKVAYAVVSFGGFLGMGEDYYPMPAELLRGHSGWIGVSSAASADWCLTRQQIGPLPRDYYEARSAEECKFTNAVNGGNRLCSNRQAGLSVARNRQLE